MANCLILIFFFTIVSMGLSPASAEESSASGAVSGIKREPRHFRRRKCWQFGTCGGQGGFQGGYQGHPGQPPINIAISQSQSSANGAGGGYTHGQYPNNHQYNGGYPNQGHYGGYPSQGFNGGYPNQGFNGGYPNQGNYGGYPNQGHYGGYPNHGGFGPGNYGNGPYNNQLNGNFYAPGGPNGYGFQRPPFGPYYDENSNQENNRPDHTDSEEQDHSGSEGYNDYNQGNQPNYIQGHEQGHASAGAFAFAGRKN